MNVYIHFLGFMYIAFGYRVFWVWFKRVGSVFGFLDFSDIWNFHIQLLASKYNSVHRDIDFAKIRPFDSPIYTYSSLLKTIWIF